MNNNGEKLLNTIMERDLGPHCTQNRNTSNLHEVLKLWVPEFVTLNEENDENIFKTRVAHQSK